MEVVREDLARTILRRISELEQQKRVMLAYLDLRRDVGDLHGVQDAASDLREIDARLDELRGL